MSEPEITSEKRILCVGNVSVDIKAYSTEENGTEAYRDGSIELVPGGVARGMAINLKRLGMDTSVLSVIGRDIFGEYLRAGLESEGVGTELLRTSNRQKTALFSVMATSGQPASCIYCTNILREIVFDADVSSFIRKKQINTLVLDSNLESETIRAFYELKQNNKNLFIFQNATAPDIAKKTLEWAPLVDLFGCNEFEASAILGKEVLPDSDTADQFQKLGYRNFIITFGERGVMVRIGTETWNEPPYTPAYVVDTIGAGDAFASGFLMGFLGSKPIKRCIHYGLACAKETLLTRQTVSSLLCPGLLESYPEKT